MAEKSKGLCIPGPAARGAPPCPDCVSREVDSKGFLLSAAPDFSSEKEKFLFTRKGHSNKHWTTTPSQFFSTSLHLKES